jgi:nucleoside-diphosphate-sugar epimerase
MKIFLAGASGVIGRSLIPRLTRAGHDVTGMTGDAAARGLVGSLGAEPVVVDVFDRDRLAEAVRTARPDAVIHQLTSLRKGDYAATNRVRTQGTRNLVDATLSGATPVVVAQSYCIYPPGPGLADETDPLDVNSPAFGPAAEALVAMEAIVSEAPTGVLLRYGTLYGPGTGYATDGAVAGQVRRGELPANKDVTSFLHLDDAAGAAVQALGWPGGPVNIVDDEPAPGTDWLPVYASAIGAAAPPPREPQTGSGLRGASNAKARKDYGWEPVHPSWREGFLTALG